MTSTTRKLPPDLRDGQAASRGYIKIFKSSYDRLGHCRIDITRRDDGRTVVVATECRTNPGASITNCAEILARLICADKHINPARLIWIEHYPPYNPTGHERGEARDETHHRVDFTVDAGGNLTAPVWTEITGADVLLLITGTDEPATEAR